jgi:hypothetical protein
VVLVSAASPRICKELADPPVALGYEMESNTPEQFATFLRADVACPSSDKESQNRLMWERGSGASVE